MKTRKLLTFTMISYYSGKFHTAGNWLKVFISYYFKMDDKLFLRMSESIYMKLTKLSFAYIHKVSWNFSFTYIKLNGVVYSGILKSSFPFFT